jgi:molybdenum cofactor synthesis domain-containing protein
MQNLKFKIAILTVSDKGSKGQRTDTSGPALKAMMEPLGAEVAAYEIVPDERSLIADKLKYYSDTLGCDLVLTTGGTGFSPRDVTPEATLDVIDRLVPGIPEAIRAKSMQITPKAMLSRAAAGIRKKTLIINLPGSEKGARESLEAVLPALVHGIEILRGDAGECGR